MTDMEKIELEKIVNESNSFSEVSRNLYGNNFYGNRQTIKKYVILYGINIDHFINSHGNAENFKKKLTSKILVINSTFDTTKLKLRLYKEGIKFPICEKCGQDENWCGEKMSLILDHINGISTDNRLENLRIVCPNCNATLPTHGGKNVKHKIKEKKPKNHKETSIWARKVKRPEYDQLKLEIKELGYSGTGRKYGVSDNAIRKWLKYYKKYN